MFLQDNLERINPGVHELEVIPLVKDGFYGPAPSHKGFHCPRLSPKEVKCPVKMDAALGGLKGKLGGAKPIPKPAVSLEEPARKGLEPLFERMVPRLGDE